MGRKSSFEGFVTLVAAFRHQATWRQDQLCKHCDLDSRTVVGVCEQLAAQDVLPLESERDGRYVVWSRPLSSIPGAIVVPNRWVPDIVRIVARARRTKVRDAILALFHANAPKKMKEVTSPDRVVTSEQSEHEEAMLSAVEAGMATRSALHARYFSKRDDATTNRHVTVLRVFPESPARFVGWCHVEKSLRWFRVSGLEWARTDRNVRYQDVPEDDVEMYVFESVDGYHGGGERHRYDFTILDPEARWMGANLLKPMQGTRVKDGVEVTITTAALDRVARYVASLGGSVVIHTPELKEAARAHALAFLESNK